MHKRPKPLMTAAAFLKANPDLPPLLIKTLKMWGRLYPSIRFSPTKDAKDGKTWFKIAGLPDEVVDNLMKSGKPMPAKPKGAKKKAAKSSKKKRPAKQVKKASRPARRK